MTIFKNLVSFILIFSLTAPGFPLHAQDPDETFVYKNPPETPAGVTCSKLNEVVPANGICCLGFEKNIAGSCDLPVIQDPALVSCVDSSTCSGGTGCFSQSSQDLFSSVSPSTEDSATLSQKKNEFQDLLSLEAGGGAIDSACTSDRNCSSYSCVGGVCLDKKVCRFVREEEFAGANFSCGSGMTKSPTGVCEIKSEETVYLGLIENEQLPKFDVNQCKFELAEETIEKSKIAMRSLRAIEWFFATISLPTEMDCTEVLPILKNEIGLPLYEARKNILSNFTEVLNQIEFDYKQVFDSKTAVQTQNITIHGDESMTNAKLFSRQTSGYDNLILMQRRNALFQSYEMGMSETINEVWESVKKVSEILKKGEFEKKECSSSKYKVKKILGSWKEKFWSGGDQWSHQYEVSGGGQGNGSLITSRENISDVLKLLGGKPQDFTSPKYYLMDALLFSGMRKIGDEKGLRKKSSFLGLFGGFQDLRKANYLKGGNESYKTWHTFLKPELTKFYKGLNKSKQKGFIYEAELVSTQAKDCIQGDSFSSEKKTEEPSSVVTGIFKPDCSEFEPFMEGVLDEAFTYFLAYSFSKDDSYSGYFKSAETYRRKLFAKLEVDMENILKYYETLKELRNQQHACIQKVVDGISESGILTSDDSDDSKDWGSLKEGPSKSQESRITGEAIRKLSKGNIGANGGKGITSTAGRSRFLFDLRGNKIRNLNEGTMRDFLSGVGTTSERGNFANTGSSLLALNRQRMKNSNKKATAAGVNVAAKNKAVNDIIDSIMNKSKSTGTEGALKSDIGGKSLSLDNGNSGRAALGSDLKKSMTSAPTGEVISDKDRGAGNNGAGSLSGGGANGGLSGYSQSGEADSSEAQSGAAPLNGSELSQDESDRLLAEVERTKADYASNDEEGIFKKVSNAYVRNLDKVLVKKKKIEP